MPCDSVVVVSVEMGSNVDSSLLFSALSRLKARPFRNAGDILFNLEGGASGRFDAKTKSLSLNLGRWGTRDATVNKIKAAYSYEVVMSSLRRVGGTARAEAASEDGRQVVHVRLAKGE